MRRRAGGSGRLFGSVGPADIAAAVREAGGPELDQRRIEVRNPIKTVGSHQVRVRLHPEVSAPRRHRDRRLAESVARHRASAGWSLPPPGLSPSGGAGVSPAALAVAQMRASLGGQVGHPRARDERLARGFALPRRRPPRAGPAVVRRLARDSSRSARTTAAMRASRAAASALLRSASSWSMASARRLSADSSIEHTIEDYQVGGVPGPACRSSVMPQVGRLVPVESRCGSLRREIRPKFFFRTAGGSRFRRSAAIYLWFRPPFPQPVPRLRTT